jgi:hypothetical protein
MQMYHSFSKHTAYADNLVKQWLWKDNLTNLSINCAFSKGIWFFSELSNLTSNFYLMASLASSLFSICRWEILFSAGVEVMQKATDAS